MGLLTDLHRDAKLLMAARGIRAFAFSYLNVVFAIYLDSLGYSTMMIGVIFTIAYLSSALLTAVWGYLSDRLGRRKILMLLAVLTIVSNVILIYFTCLFFILSAVIIANVGAGGIMGSLGALASGLPQYLQEEKGFSAIGSYKPLFVLTIVFSIALLLVYRAIHEQHQ